MLEYEIYKRKNIFLRVTGELREELSDAVGNKMVRQIAKQASDDFEAHEGLNFFRLLKKSAVYIDIFTNHPEIIKPKPEFDKYVKTLIDESDKAIKVINAYLYDIDALNDFDEEDVCDDIFYAIAHFTEILTHNCFMLSMPLSEHIRDLSSISINLNHHRLARTEIIHCVEDDDLFDVDDDDDEFEDSFAFDDDDDE